MNAREARFCLEAAAQHGRRLLTCAIFATIAAGSSRAQVPDTLPRHLSGHVVRPAKDGIAPVPGIMVTLHRVGADRAGPIDSARTAADGRYTFIYRPSGNEEAVYLASVGYRGIMYFSTPASASQGVSDGDITVFDTTSGPVRIRTAGHHVIVSAPRADATREVEEVFELSNDSSVTRIARGDSVPVWSTVAPNGAMGVQGAPTSDIAPAAIVVRGARVELYAPISPGMRQLAYGYTLRAAGFPLTLAVPTPTEVLEVLVEEPSGSASGAGLNELAPVSKGGRTFRRFLAQDVPANAHIRIDVPAAVVHQSARVVRWASIVAAGIMLLALLWGVARSGRARLAMRDDVRDQDAHAVDALLHEIVSLDVAHEQRAGKPPNDNVEYERERAALKARLVRALASRDDAR